LTLGERTEEDVEWMTDRVAYLMSERHLPEPKIVAEWQIDRTFNAAEDLLRDLGLKDVIKSAIDDHSSRSEAIRRLVELGLR
jgi:hypothetical protein